MCRNLRKADWTAFSGTFKDLLEQHKVPEKWNYNTLESESTLLAEYIEKALDDGAPKRIRRPARRKINWSEDVLLAKRKCQQLRSSRKKGNWTRELHREYREAFREKRNAIRKFNIENWRKFTSESEDPEGAAKLMRIIKRDNFVPPTLLKRNGEYTCSKKETIELLMETHFPGSLEQQDDLAEEFDCLLTDNPEKTIEPLSWID